MPSRPLAFLAVLLALLLLAVPAASYGPLSAPEVSDSSAGSQVTPTPGSTPTDPSEPDHLNTTFRVALQEDGDARWRVEATFNRTGSFGALASRFESGETDGLGYDAFVDSIDGVDEATDREMELRNRERTSETDGDTGTLVLSFTWSNFARTGGDLLYVDDGFETDSGTWLRELAADQSLVIVPPSGYGVQSAPIGVEEGIARWDGPYDFSDREPWIVYERGTVTTTSPSPSTPITTSPSTPITTSPSTTTASGTTTGPPNTTAVGPFGGLSAAWPFALVVLLAAAGVAAYAYRDDDIRSGPGDDPDGSGPGDSRGGGGAGVPAATPGSGSDAATAAGGGTEATTEAASEGAADDAIDETLLSDEERVERLLEQNGGRLKQATIVKETGWSNAKVSQLLSSMAEEGRIDKLRIGRENLISFPNEDVTDPEE